jgi:hypothetical protein
MSLSMSIVRDRAHVHVEERVYVLRVHVSSRGRVHVHVHERLCHVFFNGNLSVHGMDMNKDVDVDIDADVDADVDTGTDRP